MNNLFNLLKIEFTKSFSRQSMKENKKKSISFIAFILLIGLLGVALSSLYTFVYAQLFIETNQSPKSLIYLFAAVASMLTFFSGINQTRGIYIGSDYDLLATLPISKKTIVASKIINLYLVELTFSALVMIPNGIVLTILTKDVTCLLIDLVLAIFISALPLVLSLIFAFITSLISSKFKFANIISLILYSILFIGIMALSFSISSSADPTQQANSFNNITNVVKWLNPLIIFVEWSITKNILYIFAFIGINMAILVLITLFLSLSYSTMHELVSSFKLNNKYERKELKVKGEYKNMLGFELKRLFGSKAFLLNVVMSLIAAIFITGMACYYYIQLKNQGNELIPYVEKYAVFGIVVIIFSLGLSNYCSACISFEGKNFWLLKTLPINKKTILNAKLMTSIILQIVFSIICSTIIVVIVNVDIFTIIMLYLIPIMYLIFTSLFGLVINLIFYSLKWDNEQKVIKNSKSVIITMFATMLFDLIALAILVLLSIYVNVYVGSLTLFGVLGLISLLLYIDIIKRGPKKLNRIENF